MYMNGVLDQGIQKDLQVSQRKPTISAFPPGMHST